MKSAAAFLATLLLGLSAAACGSNGDSHGAATGADSGGGSNPGACAGLGIPAGNCQTCEESSCAGALSAMNSTCGGSLSCLCACAAGDATCASNCAASAACETDVANLGSCVVTQCAASCGESGTPSADGGGVSSNPGASSFSGPSCPATSPPNSFAPAGASADCAKCAASCVTANDFTTACSGYYGCYCPCAAGDTSCQSACAPLENGTCSDTTAEVTSCVTDQCASLCGTCPVLAMGTYTSMSTALMANQPAGCTESSDAEFLDTIFKTFTVDANGQVSLDGPQGAPAGCQLTTGSCTTVETCALTLGGIPGPFGDAGTTDDFTWSLTPQGTATATATLTATSSGVTCGFTITYGPSPN